jgi:peptidyl-tRNA hydrolase, PTH1 family
MKLIVGLGNPGAKYQNTLHNVGFAAIDFLCQRRSLSNWATKFKGLYLKESIGGAQFILLKPQTYMNLSGESVLACVQFFKLDLEDVLVISDDVDRPAGTLRYRASGGHGGHNGLRSITQLCGSNQFHRIKIGIGRPEGKIGVADYVLGNPPEEVKISVNNAIEAIDQYLTQFIQNQPVQIDPQYA